MLNKQKQDRVDLYLSNVTDDFPPWWLEMDEKYRKEFTYTNIPNWKLSNECLALRSLYVERFGEEIVNKRIPKNNWMRADFCYHLMPDNLAMMDIGSGLGEFVNLCSLNGHNAIISVDIKDYSLWFDAASNVNRVYKSIYDLDETNKTDVVTCFEVIEHLPPNRLLEAINKLRFLAKKKLYISVPFMESYPLYKGHFTRFDPSLLTILFPDAKFTVINKNSKIKPEAWVLMEIDCE